MTLRTRLILAFLLMSVVPLGALTYYTYVSNAKALRDAAQREADLLADELGQRMQLVTAQLSQRLEFLMDIAQLQDELERAAVAPAPVTVTASAKPEDTDALGVTVAKALGDAAVFLSNVELVNWRQNRDRPPRAGGAGGAGAGGTGVGASGSGRGTTTMTARGGGDASGDPRVIRRGQRGGTQGGAMPPRVGAAPPTAGVSPPPAVPPPPPPGVPPPAPRTPAISSAQKEPSAAAPGQTAAPTPPTPPDPAMELEGKLTIDLRPIQREIFQQVLPDGKVDNLSREDWQRVVREVNSRMLGIQKGLQLGAEAIRQQAETAAKEEAAKKAAEAAESSQPGTPVRPAAVTRSTSVSGTKLDVVLKHDGEVVRQANVELNLPAVLQTVFTTTRHERGEVPFAIDPGGRLYTTSDDNRRVLQSFGDIATPEGPNVLRLPDWIVVTTNDPTGTGLKLGIARPVGDSLGVLRRTTARNAAIGLGFIGLALIGIVPLSGRLTRNLSTLSDGVRRIARGDYHARVHVKGRDEVASLASAFNQMAEDVERHQRAAVEQERLKRELELGRQIQAEMLPRAPLRLGLTEVQGVSVPAREVGGDFFNYFETPTGQLALLVGDVSGKGVGAALLMANIQASLRTRLALGQDLSDLAKELDRDVEAGSPAPVYATLFIGLLDPQSRVLRYVNAGHNPQYILRRSGGLTQMGSTGMPIGLFAGHGYEERAVQLAAGDVLFFYTDGCVEAENEAGEMFGTDRLEGLLTSADEKTNLLARVENAVTEFRGANEPHDDATIMTVRIG